MVKWHQRSEIYLGDGVGNPVRAWIGVVQVDRRTTIGIKVNPSGPSDRPDFTLDEEAAGELLVETRKQLMALSKTLPGGL